MCRFRMNNLEAELARFNVTRKDIAELWGVDVTTVNRNVEKMTITLEQATKLKDYLNYQSSKKDESHTPLKVQYLFFDNVSKIED